MKAEEIWHASGKELASMIERGLFLNKKGKIRFYTPSFINYKTNYFRSSQAFFPSISITGSSCALKCKHCDGKVLNTMFPAPSPKELFELCRELKEKGAIGCLISGGCLPDGSVPLDEFVDAIAKVKKELGLTIVAHTGVIELSTAEKLKRAGVDAALIDIIGSDQTIREVYRLEISVEDYDRSLKALHKSGIPFVPHLLVGLHYGKLKGELQALKMISNHSPSAIIMIAFMPIHGTPMEKVNPPNPEDIAKVLVTARLMMPKVPIALGCMRPKGKHRTRTDILAVTAGVNAIAFPDEEAIRLAESLGLEISFSPICCSQIFKDLTL
ncbi:MAG: radical SAM protein [Candidatus Bathyarchaeota archaeon]|nr:radical SAM protein [Candidatus Bathyarchaeota archaeon]